MRIGSEIGKKLFTLNVNSRAQADEVRETIDSDTSRNLPECKN